MTDDNTLKRIARESYQQMADRRCSCSERERLAELARLVGAWRASRCSRNGCDGDLHLSACPVQLALDDMIAAHNALGAPGMVR